MMRWFFDTLLPAPNLLSMCLGGLSIDGHFLSLFVPLFLRTAHGIRKHGTAVQGTSKTVGFFILSVKIHYSVSIPSVFICWA
jgi:hypothetical protein